VPFRLRNDARTWFKAVRESGFELDFDSFYFCFIAGVAAKQKKDIATAEAPELVDYFPERYRDRGRLLIALFLAREIQLLGIDISEKKTVHAEVSRLIRPDSPSYLSEDGMREFNRYAHGGFEVLADWFDDRPRRLDTFLRGFKARLDDTLRDQARGLL
jgi:hypothetical protein